MKSAVALIILGNTVLCGQTAIDRAFQQLYNQDFAAAQRIADEHLQNQPDDPLGYGVKASAYLFQELDRLGILESDFFASDKRIGEKKKLKADPEVKAKFDQAIEGLRTRAERQIAAKPNSADAMFAMSIAAGLKGDYVALVERKQFSSWTYIKESNQWTVKLLATNPNYTDAYLTSGMTEYIVGSIPFFIRWMVKVDGVEGSKIAGVAKLKKVAESGRYFRPFAKILLAICSVREKKFDETRQLLTELTNEFPRNPQFKRELEKLKKVKGSATAAQGSPIDGQ